MAREIQTKEVTIDGQAYTVKKFTPDKACKWAFRLFGKMTNIQADDDLTVKIQEFTNMPEKDFKEFQKDCLGFVEAIFPAGAYPLLNPDGSYVVPDIKATTIFQLTLHSFMFSIVDFFDPALLQSIVGITQPDTKSMPDQPSP